MTEGIERGVDTVHDLGQSTAVHVRRVACILTGTVGRLAGEVADLVWDCRALLGRGLRKPPEEFDIHRDVGSIDLSAAVQKPKTKTSPTRR